MGIQIKDFCFVAFPVADVARARSFYEGLLGLKPGRMSEGAGDKWWIEYDIAGACLAISNLFPAGAHGGVPVMLEVADLDAAYTTLRAAGVPITEELQEYPLCRSFGAKDPDGNDLGFHQHKPAHLIPAFDPATARKVAPYSHAPTGGRIVGFRQPAAGGRAHLFSSTGIFIATEQP